MTTSLSESLARRAPPGPLWVAFSGGLDSTVLLHLLVAAGLGPRLTVLHVDHGLHPDSGVWAAHCTRQAVALGLNCRVEQVRVSGREGLEGNARRARYDALCRHAESGTLITAHHRDDQSETLLLRLLRGAGPTGLSAIPEHGHWGVTPLWRPLLAVPRAELRALAERAGWSWLEDPSNDDLNLERNYLRGHLLPQLEQRWPGVRAVLARTAGHQAEAAALLAERAREDAAALGVSERQLPLTAIAALSRARGNNLLRGWLADAGAPPPSSAVMAEILALTGTSADRLARVQWGGWQIRRFRDALHLLENSALRPLTGETLWSPASRGPRLGAWRLVEGEGAGNALLWLAADAGNLRLAPARGGERLLRNGHHQRVSELWRAAGVPPWRREQWPLVYLDEDLVSVPAVGVADGWKHRPLTAWHLEPA